mgnify:CR=1 FL=1
MGFFDFLKKKPQEQPVVEQTEEKDVVEIAGIEVNTTPEKEEDIVLNVNENLGTTTAINQAVHEVMDEEEIEFHEKAGGTLYQENDDIAAAEEEPEVEIELTTEETVVPEDAEAFTEELTELVEEGLEAAAESERELQVETAEEKFVEETDAEGQQFVEELADFVAEELEAEQEEEIVEETAAAELEAVPEEAPAPVKEKKGFFARLKEGLDKTRKNILGGVDTVLGSFTKIDEDLFEELEEALIMADMGVQTTMDIVENLRQRVKKERATDPAVIKDMLIDEITAILQDGVEEEENLPSPTVMLVRPQPSGNFPITSKTKASLYCWRQQIHSVRRPLTSWKFGGSVPVLKSSNMKKTQTLRLLSLMQSMRQETAKQTCSSAIQQDVSITKRTSWKNCGKFPASLNGNTLRHIKKLIWCWMQLLDRMLCSRQKYSWKWQILQASF